jgi:hypothetical protein
MIGWIETPGAWVNSAHVVTIEKDYARGHVLKGADGATLGRAEDGVLLLPVPAAPGTTLLTLWEPDGPDGVLMSDRKPIVAWLVSLANYEVRFAVTLAGRFKIDNDGLNENDDGPTEEFRVVRTADGGLFAVVEGCTVEDFASLGDAEVRARSLLARWRKGREAEDAA